MNTRMILTVGAGLLAGSVLSRADIIYISNVGDGSIVKFDTATGANLGTFASGVDAPYGIALDSSGNLYAANYDISTIQKVSPAGAGSVFASTAGYPLCLGFDSAGNLYAGCSGGSFANTIQKFTPGGGGSVFAGTDPREAIGLAFDRAGNLYASDDNYIEKCSSTGSDLGAFASGLSGARGLAFDGSGNLYVTMVLNNIIEEFTPGGVGSVFASGGLDGPYALAFDSLGSLYVANLYNNSVEQFSSAGVDLGVFASGLSTPYSIAIEQVPEPSGLALLGLGAALMICGWCSFGANS